MSKQDFHICRDVIRREQLRLYEQIRHYPGVEPLVPIGDGEPEVRPVRVRLRQRVTRIETVTETEIEIESEVWVDGNL